MNINLIKQATGVSKADLVLKNCKIVNVFTRTIETEDIAISNGIIVGVGKYQGNKEVDLSGFFISPGFIDGHCHIESSMVTPQEYAKIVIPKGTTTVIADCHEIANVCGKDGVKFMLDSAEKSPLDVFMMIPSCVPATSFETSGATLNAKDIEELKSLKNVIGLGEMMNYPGVINADKSVYDKLDVFKNQMIDGHAPEVFGNDLNAYILAGVKTDHECTTALELEDKVKRGMYIHLREGSQTRNVIDLLPGVKDAYLSRLLFCTDDIHPNDILKDGHINYNINLAINHGLDPIKAITMATINTANCYNLEYYGAIAPGYFADLVIFEDLNNIQPKYVYKKGEMVAYDNKPLFETQKHIDESTLNTINFDINNFKFKYDLKFDMVNIIKLVKNNIITRLSVEEVKLIDGDVLLDKDRDLLKLFIIERHHNTGNIGKALLSGYGLKNAAIALSIAHDSHNIVLVSDNETDSLVALKKIKEMTGGIVLVSKGKILGSLQLEVGGIMTNGSAIKVRDDLENLEKQIRNLGVSEEIVDPFLSLAFLSLPVVPEIKVTDLGLFDVRNFKLITLEAGDTQ
ncbi:adenine deaminase [Candidatus Izemoplasma sp. B36]|uniref:adenine deaminase n=1 Tax=Candidatus Izemoplasma sp. B36 TaxID=3242468 RepID=UPI00355673EB